MKIVVIGGGASGLMCAIRAKNNDNQITILESNTDIGKKILSTGNGRCNYWHHSLNISSYHSDYSYNLEEILSHQDKVLTYLTNLGLVPKIKDGYYYPMSNQASAVRDLFKFQIKKKNIEVISNFQVIEVLKEEELFIIKGNEYDITCDKIVIATGSPAGSKLDTACFGYNLLKTLGHNINPVLPSLTPLIVNRAKKYNWGGIRCDAELTLISDSKTLKIERGELQLTDNGLSGICTFNISGIASRELNNHKEVSVAINFLPDIEDVNTYLDTRNKEMGDVSVDELLNSLLNYKLIGVILNIIRISGTMPYSKLTSNQKKWLASNISEFTCSIIATEDYNRAQVCTGGISLKEINPKNMESLIVPRLYIIGETLDVDGDCGGYNLAFAFITGYLAGSDINNA